MKFSKVTIVAAACAAGMVLVASAPASRADTVNAGIASLPTPTGSQIVLAANPVDNNGNGSAGTLNYYSNSLIGQTFTTGSNADGYMVNSIAVYDQWEQGTGFATGNVVTMNLFQPTTGATVGPVLYTGTGTVGTPGGGTSWVVYTFSTPPVLQPNTLYAFSYQANNGYSGMGITVGNGTNSGTGSPSQQLATFYGASPTTPTYYTGNSWWGTGWVDQGKAVSATNDPTDVFTDNSEFQIIGTPATTPVPEPAPLAMMALAGLAALAIKRRKPA